MGIDLAEHVDYSVAAVAQKEEGHLNLVHMH